MAELPVPSDPKYSFGFKLLMAGAAVLVAAYFGVDIQNYVSGWISSAGSTVTKLFG
jgi:hypothetical protein